MNRFILDSDPLIASQMHCDRHVVKMILEEAQMLSTAHRVLDGVSEISSTQTGRKITRWRMSDSREGSLYKATHVNHPCLIWCRATNSNYEWAYSLFINLCKEYTSRYGRIHMTETKLLDVLKDTPKNIPQGPLTKFPQAMPEDCKTENSIAAYRNYYLCHKKKIAQWTKRNIPDWYLKEELTK